MCCSHRVAVAHIHIERAQSEQHQLVTKMDLQRGSSPYLGTLGEGKGMRETRLEWTEFAWLFGYICLTDFFFAHTPVEDGKLWSL